MEDWIRDNLHIVIPLAISIIFFFIWLIKKMVMLLIISFIGIIVFLVYGILTGDKL